MSEQQGMHITSKIDIDDLIDQLFDFLSAEETIEFVKKLESINDDWGLTFKIRAHFMRLCKKYDLDSEDEYLCEECHEIIFMKKGHHESCSKSKVQNE